MTYTIGLGLLGHARQWYLPGTDTGALPPPPADDAPPLLHAIVETNTSPVPSDPLFGGLVQVIETSERITVDVLGAWNSVKNGTFVSEGAESLVMSGFVHADVMLGGEGNSSVLLLGAKRGNVVTGAGDDVVNIQVATNGAEWVNEFRLATGEGGDTVILGALDIAAAAAFDSTFAATTHGAGDFTGNAAGTLVIADLGGGDDRFVARGESRDHVLGGAGGDIIDAGGGADTLAGGEEADIFFFARGDGQDVIVDFAPGEDRLLFRDLDPGEIEAILAGAVEQDGGTLLARGADSVLLLDLLPSALTPADFL
ncbi:hypothetical protein GXW74_04700 [Roseomonas eburnea]|uniref:Calcium-binding protein n=1 Tax=Neoroseomonas eburnea TaxID=1346889 RepID=A0A9X9X7T8_9PROT|nr:hypothetical protein [Neoroseomonas eburnea]MBR0679774.1 hypothetical protein [Neoroseomonas eburnea]